MRKSTNSQGRLARLAVGALVVVSGLSGCAVVSVASTAVGLGVGVVGLAADAAVGTVRITGKVIGAAADAVLPESEAAAP